MGRNVRGVRDGRNSDGKELKGSEGWEELSYESGAVMRMERK
jgi:hypothetical protein